MTKPWIDDAQDFAGAAAEAAGVLPDAGSDAGWGWWAGDSEENLTIGPEPTREAVIKAAIDEELGITAGEEGENQWKLSFYVCEARQDPLKMSDYITASGCRGDIGEELIARAGEEFAESDLASEDDEDFFGMSENMGAVNARMVVDLSKRIKAAIDEWQDENKLVFRARTFTATRNEAWVEHYHQEAS